LRRASALELGGIPLAAAIIVVTTVSTNTPIVATLDQNLPHISNTPIIVKITASEEIAVEPH
jgi:hypothetical protein